MQTPEQREYKRRWRASNRGKENSYMRSYRQRHPEQYEKHKAVMREYHSEHADIRNSEKRRRYSEDPLFKQNKRSGNRRWLYGITAEEFNALISKQDGRCAVCQRERPSKGRDFCVDHDHETGIIRGILCIQCNAALGLLSESRETIIRLAAYLERDNA